MPATTSTAMKATIRPRAIVSHLASVSPLAPCAWSCSAVVTATLASPRLASFPRRDRGDDERRHRIRPPPAEEGVRAESEHERHGQVRAEQVLLPLLRRRDRAQPLP